MASTVFAPSGEDAITRSIDVQKDTSTPDFSSVEEFKEYYEIRRIAAEIIQGKFKRIALQFPDELLHDSVSIYRYLNAEIGDSIAEEVAPELYVLADTSYGSCCADEVAAQHVDANLIVHYGHACMSKTYRIPVLYVFGKRQIDVDGCVTQLTEIVKSHLPEEQKAIILRHDVSYAHAADIVVTRLRESLAHVAVHYSRLPSRLDPSIPKSGTVANQTSLTSDEGQSSSAHYEGDGVHGEPDAPLFLYIGGESLGLINLLITHSSSVVYSYDPESRTTRLESGRTNKLLMRRYATVQKARDADIFGILAGTLGIASYLPMISHLRSLLARHRKKTYTISVGKLNPAKVANFMEIECFVLVACPENSLIESKEFLKPIVTPYELEIALQAEQSWSGKYVLDFERLLVEHVHQDAEENRDDRQHDGSASDEDPDQPTFSVVTGKYRTARRFGAGTSNPSYIEADTPSAVILRNQNNTVAALADSAAAEYLQSRTFQGLETRVGEDAPSVLEQGRSGIAKGYGNDKAEQ